jgi:hypothetical protein
MDQVHSRPGETPILPADISEVKAPFRGARTWKWVGAAGAVTGGRRKYASAEMTSRMAAHFAADICS